MSEQEKTYTTNVPAPQAIKALRNRPCAKHWTHPEYRSPTGEEIEALQNITGWKAKKIGKIIGATYTEKGCSIVRKWKLPEGHHEHRSISYAAWRLLLIVAGVVSLDDEILEAQSDYPMVAYRK